MPAPAPSERWLKRSGADLRWRDEGAGPAVLLLHGWALDMDLFDLIVRQCSGRLRLLRFDRRGYGRSEGAPSLDADGEDALAVLDAARVGRCAVVGMSQGARVATALATRAPDRIERLVLDGAPALQDFAIDDHEPELPLEEYRALLESGGTGALAAALARHPLLQLQDAAGAEARATLARMLGRYPGRDLRIDSAATTVIAAPAQPVLVLNGEHDSPVRLRIGAHLGATLPRAARHLIPGAGHLACLDTPAAYAAALLSFVLPAKEHS
jgi:pimeloyl-ACP methyl ester carboxylesterase